MMGSSSALLEGAKREDSLELIATKLRLPLSVLKQSAEGLAQQLRDSQGDPTDITAAEDLVHSAERMSQLVQLLIQASRAPDA
ncbi:hypothetical protein [Hyalangium gracile]|uniref:hypothetical protein n=1 Tax=Hyalangium gracile TaxID=394092 RepID=UPI001CCFCA2F|nr:hypothetical protein [Hyalangium gracile]